MSSPVDDDLEFNPFYLALQQHFHIPYQEAQQKCHVICVPHSQVLAGQTIDSNFVEMHILRPSPFFRGAYVTTDRGNTKSLVLENGFLKTDDGFNEERSIRIVADETGYNKDMKPYKILILDSTIWPMPKVYVRTLSEGIYSQHSFKWTVAENIAYLKSFPEHREVIRDLDKQIRQFNDNYMVLQKYLSDAAAKLEETWVRAIADFKRVSMASAFADGRYDKQLAIALETYIMDGVNKKVYAVVKGKCAREGRVLQEKKSQISILSADKLGLNPQFSCPQDAAVKEISRLRSLTAPIEKILCMKNTLDIISRTVESYLVKYLSFSQKSKTCLASDDLIPLLVMVIAQTSDIDLMPNMLLIELFHWSTSSTDDLSYSLVTFKAATQYILDTDFSERPPTPPSGATPLSEETEEEDALQDGANLPVAGSSTGAGSATRLDRELNRITKLLEVSSISSIGSTSQHPPPPRSRPSTFNYDSSQVPAAGSHRKFLNKKQDSGLGEFLSSLKDDGLYSRYGKQS